MGCTAEAIRVSQEILAAPEPKIRALEEFMAADSEGRLSAREWPCFVARCRRLFQAPD